MLIGRIGRGKMERGGKVEREEKEGKVRRREANQNSHESPFTHFLFAI